MSYSTHFLSIQLHFETAKFIRDGTFPWVTDHRTPS
jgi:hypothetical protein